MTKINLKGMELVLGGLTNSDEVLIELQYWADGKPFFGVENETAIFSPPSWAKVKKSSPPLELEPTEGLCCLKMRLTSSGISTGWLYFEIPDTTEVDFGMLVQVDPDTYAPISSEPTILDSVRMELLDGVILKKITQDDYDNLPEPRPEDTLYIVKPD